MKSFLSGLIAERHHASHPQPLALGGADLVADTLAGDLALKLGKGQEHVEGQPAHGGRGIELLLGRDPGIDCTADLLGRFGHHVRLSLRRPKKRGPDQRVPVMAKAISVRLR